MITLAGYCDDGNKVDGDGCSSSCSVESHYSCTLGSSTTASVCSDICGDGYVVITGSTYCDDGNTASNDGCSSTCAVESKWSCTSGSSTAASVCSDKCQDGFVVVTSSTYCDDGNAAAGDGCSSLCVVEYGYVCTSGSSTAASTCVLGDVCGDGKTEIA